MNIAAVFKALIAPRVIMAKLPFIGAAICLVLLGVHYLNAGEQPYKYALAWALALVSIHTSVRPSWLGFSLITGLYLSFAGIFMKTLVDDYQSGQPYIAGPVYPLVIVAVLLCLIGWYFWRCRPGKLMDGDYEQAPLMGHRWLPEKKTKK